MDETILDKLKEIENSKTFVVDISNCYESNEDLFIGTSDYYIEKETKIPRYRVQKHFKKSDGKLIWLDIEDLKTGIHLTS